MAIKTEYTRVTALLYPFSGMKDIPQHLLDGAAERGSKVHEMIAAQEAGIGLMDLNKAYEGYFVSYQKFAAGKDFLPVPARFYDDDLMITGECDALYKDRDDLVLVDYKTPAKESKTWKLQGSAYSYLAKKNGYKISRIEFVKLDKEGNDPKIYQYTEDMDFIRKLIDVYRYFYKADEKENILDYL